ncbi:MAG: glycosyltransferase, partial [Maribacter sp.]
LPMLIGNFAVLPLITTIHTPIFEYLSLGAENRFPCDNHRFVMVSKSLRRTWNSIIEGAEVVYNGIDIRKWRFNADPEGDYLFWYGRICKEKGTHLAIEAAIKSQHKLILAGPISNDDYFNEYVSPLLTAGNIEYAGHLHQAQINDLLCNASAFLFTSTWSEPYGLTLAESLSCGTPVVAFDSGAAKEILTQDCGTIVEQGCLYKFIKAIYRTKKLNRHYCRLRAVNFCSHELMVDAYVRIYNEISCDDEYMKESKL